MKQFYFVAFLMCYQLTNKKTGKMLPAQLADSVTLLFIPEAQMPAGATNTYILKPASRKFPYNIKVQQQTNGLHVTVNKKPLLFYHTKEAMPPPDSPAYYRRSVLFTRCTVQTAACLLMIFPQTMRTSRYVQARGRTSPMQIIRRPAGQMHQAK